MKPSKLEVLKQIALDRGGKCLSEEYIHSHKKLHWECARGHHWQAMPSNVKSGTWCPHCANEVKRSKKLTIDKMQGLAGDRGGKCISERYYDAHTKLLWECSKGHRWEALPRSIASGSWCPVCFGVPILTIEDMQKIASKRGGKCLSVAYKNNRIKLLWECSAGHRWEAMPRNILEGSWCRLCQIAERYHHSKTD